MEPPAAAKGAAERRRPETHLENYYNRVRGIVPRDLEMIILYFL